MESERLLYQSGSESQYGLVRSAHKRTLMIAAADNTTFPSNQYYSSRVKGGLASQHVAQIEVLALSEP